MCHYEVLLKRNTVYNCSIFWSLLHNFLFSNYGKTHERCLLYLPRNFAVHLHLEVIFKVLHLKQFTS